MKASAFVTLACMALSTQAGAAGWQVMEQSASGLGNAMAGSAAVADDASTNYFNPAGLTRLPGLQVSAGAVGIRAKVEATGGGGNVADTLLLPNLYVAMPVAGNWSVGLGISRPYAVSTDYPAGWAGATEALRSEVTSLNVNPSVAYRLNDKVALGFGLNYQKIDLDLTSSVAGNSFAGDDGAFGWNAGALFTLSPAMRVGVSYRSGFDHHIDGRRNGVSSTADLRLPGSLTLSVWQQVSDHWEAMGDLSYVDWSRMNASSVGLTTGARYQDSWRFAWGAAYRQSDALKFKFGFAYDKAATRYGQLSLRAPEYDRFWLTTGVQWNAGRLGRFDLGYAYKFSRDAEAPLATGAGKYDLGEHVLGLQYSAGF